MSTEADILEAMLEKDEVEMAQLRAEITKLRAEREAAAHVWLRDVGTDEDPCWVVCNKVDRGAVLFIATELGGPKS